MADLCPVQESSIIWRHWWFSIVVTVGIPTQLDERWLCPVRYRNGEYGIVYSVPRLKMNGLEVMNSSELSLGPEFENAIRYSDSMPEIILWNAARCLIGFTENAAEFEIEVTFLPDGTTRHGRINAVAH